MEEKFHLEETFIAVLIVARSLPLSLLVVVGLSLPLFFLSIALVVVELSLVGISLCLVVVERSLVGIGLCLVVVGLRLMLQLLLVSERVPAL